MTLFDPASLLGTWERGSGEPRVEQAVTLLAAVTGRGADESAALDVGSRDVLLADQLRRTAGGTVWTVTTCGACQERLDVPVDVAAVARMPVHEPGAVFTTAEGSTVRFRLPTSADLVAARGCDPAAARRLLVRRCVEEAEIPESTVEVVEAAMDAVAPAGALEVAVRCGECGATTTAGLDVATLLWAEVEAGAAHLVRDVHELVRAYGWSEAEVLALSPRRRAAYLELADS